jgi:hypothetical protein
MPTSWNTHDYDGKLRDKWFQMRPMLIEKYLPNCLSFDNTIKEIEQWLNKKYYNVKRIGRARRSIDILTSQRRSNFDSRNDIDVEELLPILWNQVKNQEDIHNTFYEQLCDITGGSCSQGRSTRLFQFLFLFDLPSEISTTTSNTEQEGEKKEISTETTRDDNSGSIPEEKPQLQEEKPEAKQPAKEESIPHQKQQQQQIDQQSQEEKQSHVEEKTEEKQQSQNNQESNHLQQINSSHSNKIE